MASTNDNFKFIKSSPLFSDLIRMIIPLKNGKILAFTKTEPIKILNEELLEELKDPFIFKTYFIPFQTKKNKKLNNIFRKIE